MKTMKSLIAALSIVVLAGALPALAGSRDGERGMTEGRARIVKVVPKADAGIVQIPLTVDLRNVRSEGQPANLAGYLAVVEFDSSAVSFEDAAGGENKNFSAIPVFTNRDLANGNGRVKVTAAHTHELGSAGEVNVASLRFRELTPGGANTIRVSFESLATPLSSMTKQIREIKVSE